MLMEGKKFNVVLETFISSYNEYKALLEALGDMFELIPRNDEERVLLLLLEANYTWDKVYVWKNNERICKINFVSDQIVFSPTLEVDPYIVNITPGYKYYWKGEEWSN